MHFRTVNQPAGAHSDSNVLDRSLVASEHSARARYAGTCPSSPARQYHTYSNLAKVQARIPWSRPSTLHGLVHAVRAQTDPQT